MIDRTANSLTLKICNHEIKVSNSVRYKIFLDMLPARPQGARSYPREARGLRDAAGTQTQGNEDTMFLVHWEI